ncbi:MAG TPA: hypothetical protein VIK94_00530, partial [Bacilli bacterium]
RTLDYFKGKDFEEACLESFKEIQEILYKIFGPTNMFDHFTKVHKWNFGKVKLIHSYNDSVRGYEETLKFIIK